METLSDAMQSVVDEIHWSTEARSAALRTLAAELAIKRSELRSDTHNLLGRYGLERNENARALRQKLSSEEEARKESAQRHLEDVATEVSELRGELGLDLDRARRIWRRRAEGPPPPPTTMEEVLSVVSSHPEGLRLVEIGNELGVNWRTLIGATKDLVDEGKLEKVETSYYPIH